MQRCRIIDSTIESLRRGKYGIHVSLEGEMLKTRASREGGEEKHWLARVVSPEFLKKKMFLLARRRGRDNFCATNAETEHKQV